MPRVVVPICGGVRRGRGRVRAVELRERRGGGRWRCVSADTPVAPRSPRCGSGDALSRIGTWTVRAEHPVCRQPTGYWPDHTRAFDHLPLQPRGLRFDARHIGSGVWGVGSGPGVYSIHHGDRPRSHDIVGPRARSSNWPAQVLSTESPTWMRGSIDGEPRSNQRSGPCGRGHVREPLVRQPAWSAVRAG